MKDDNVLSTRSAPIFPYVTSEFKVYLSEDPHYSSSYMIIFQTMPIKLHQRSRRPNYQVDKYDGEYEGIIYPSNYV
ncbi:hypothetical protein H5410_036858 [Solanum commersonii]|uniref:Uncharacterized protein n=1 Tax=Solanum commersonii TaxID=4109 RepID=A0A9J5Y6F0_SOLCO|nr:hypothetical protein H5410_036858 [Solanum commersonii]